jgi:hypothetical protein
VFVRAADESARIRRRHADQNLWLGDVEALASRDRLHKAAVILNDRTLHDLTNDDVFWDKIVGITSIGECEVYEITMAEVNNVVAQGISVAIDISELGCEQLVALESHRGMAS